MKQYLTIDIGGSSIKHALIDEALNLSHSGTLPAPHSLEEFQDSICGLYENSPAPVEGIAMSLAATINPQSGYILLAGPCVICGRGGRAVASGDKKN